MLSFDDTVIKTIEEVVRNVFEDDETVRVFFQYLKKDDSQILDEWVQVFESSLPKIFGKGYIIIEDLILETLYSKYDLDFVWKKDYKFTDYIVDLRMHKGEKK